MMVRRLHDLNAAAALLRRSPATHAYALGDLAEPFASRTQFFAAFRDDDTPSEIVALYRGLGAPALIAHAQRSTAAMITLTDAVLTETSGALMIQADPELLPTVSQQSTVLSSIQRTRMWLSTPAALPAPDPRVRRLGPEHAGALHTLYDVAYPGSWFDPTLLALGRVFGVLDGHDLLATAGVHVVAPDQDVAVIGNVTTRPDARRRGLARACTAALARDLLRDCSTVVLNVSSSDPGARALYAGLGFQPVFDLLELMVVR